MDNTFWSVDNVYDNYWWLKGNSPPEDWVPGTGGLEPVITDPNHITIIVAGGTGDAWSFGYGAPRTSSIDKWR